MTENGRNGWEERACARTPPRIFHENRRIAQNPFDSLTYVHSADNDKQGPMMEANMLAVKAYTPCSKKAGQL
jgi:hypothetical protein